MKHKNELLQLTRTIELDLSELRREGGCLFPLAIQRKRSKVIRDVKSEIAFDILCRLQIHLLQAPHALPHPQNKISPPETLR